MVVTGVFSVCFSCVLLSKQLSAFDQMPPAPALKDMELLLSTVYCESRRVDAVTR